MLAAMQLASFWQVQDSYHICLMKLQRLGFRVTYIYRVGNWVADRLACMGFSLDDQRWWIGFPTDVLDYLVNDPIGVVNFRVH